MKFAQKLKDLRKQKKVTQAELGKAIGKSNRVISYYENEEYDSTMPPYDVVKAIADYFEVPTSYFDDSGNSAKLEFIEAVYEATVTGEMKWESAQAVVSSKDQKIINKILAVHDDTTFLNYFSIQNNILVLVSDLSSEWLLIGPRDENAISNSNDIASIRDEEVESKVSDLKSVIKSEESLAESTLLSSTLDYIRKNNQTK